MKRKYFRKCGCCGERFEQAELIRTDESPNGWVCQTCLSLWYPEYDIESW